MAPSDFLQAVLTLLGGKHVVVEVLLQGLVGEVDAKLLEAVRMVPRLRVLENLEPKDVQYAHDVLAWVNAFIPCL